MVTHEQYLIRFDELCMETIDNHKDPFIGDGLESLSSELTEFVNALQYENNLLNEGRSRILKDAESNPLIDIEMLAHELLAKHNECLNKLSN